MPSDDVQLGTRVPPEIRDRVDSVAIALNLTKRETLITLLRKGLDALTEDERHKAQQAYDVLKRARGERPGMDAPPA